MAGIAIKYAFYAPDRYIRLKIFSQPGDIIFHKEIVEPLLSRRKLLTPPANIQCYPHEKFKKIICTAVLFPVPV